MDHVLGFAQAVLGGSLWQVSAVTLGFFVVVLLTINFVKLIQENL